MAAGLPWIPAFPGPSPIRSNLTASQLIVSTHFGPLMTPAPASSDTANDDRAITAASGRLQEPLRCYMHFDILRQLGTSRARQGGCAWPQSLIAEVRRPAELTS